MNPVNRSLVVAHGPLRNVIILAIVMAVVILVGTYLDPFTKEYEVKTAVRVACTSYINDVRHQQKHDGGWKEEFIRKARMAGANLKPEQYDFAVAPNMDRASFVCTAAVAWKETTEIFLVGTILGLKPITIVHRIDMKHEVKNSY